MKFENLVKSVRISHLNRQKCYCKLKCLAFLILGVIGYVEAVNNFFKNCLTFKETS